MSEDQIVMKWAIRGVIGFVVIMLLIFFSPFGIVNAGHRGVLLNMGRVSGTVIGEGFYFKVPFVQRVKELPVRIVKLETSAPAYSKDIQVVDTVIALNYHLVPDQVNQLYRDIGPDWETVVIQPAIQESVKSVVARYTSQELLDKRAQVKDEIKAELVARLQTRFMVVDEFSINDFSFSDQYEQSIEAKQKAQQDALTAQNNLAKVEFEAKQRVAQATAEAEAIKIQAQAITQQGGKEYVNLKTIEKWNGAACTQYCGLEASTGLLIQR